MDYATYQAFYDVENTLVYQRLPVWLVEPGLKFYPKNLNVLTQVIDENDPTYAVISKESRVDIKAIAQNAGKKAEVIGMNDQYLIIQFR